MIVYAFPVVFHILALIAFAPGLVSAEMFEANSAHCQMTYDGRFPFVVTWLYRNERRQFVQLDDADTWSIKDIAAKGLSHASVFTGLPSESFAISDVSLRLIPGTQLWYWRVGLLYADATGRNIVFPVYINKGGVYPRPEDRTVPRPTPSP